ncbi:MAG TPA: hypothetical protein VF331_09150 [Polyangiales bacterium]
MNQVAQQDGTAMDGQAHGRGDQSGSFRIHGPMTQAVLPPASAAASQAFSLDEIQPVEELDLQAEPSSSPSQPPPVPAAALSVRSGLLPRPLAGTDEPVQVHSALLAYYGELRAPERVDLRIDDLSFDPENPYARSSLLPPPRKPFPVLKSLAFVAAGAVIGAVAYGVALQHVQARAVRTVAGAAPQALVAQAAASSAEHPLQPAPAAGVATTPSPITTTAAPVPAAPAKAEAPIAATPVSVARAKRVVAAPSETPAVAAQPEPAAPAVAPVPAAVVASETAAPADSAAVAAAEPAEVLPVAPTRDEIKAGFDGVRGEIEACAAGGHGTTVAKVSISGAGRVSYATIEGAFQGTPQGSCMARVLRSASFPRFSQLSLKVSYPMGL